MGLDLLFDLDGTLTDPAAGITASIQHALARLGWEKSPEREALRRYIGPPLRQSFAEILGTDEGAIIEPAVAAYRERFAETGIYENDVYPDVAGGLTRLKGEGHRLWVATSKPEIFARRIIEHFNLAPVFHRVYGSDLDGKNSDKTDLIANIIARERLAPSQVYMIGDRAHDIAGGRANDTRTIGVLWGYGSEEEIRNARPDIVVDSIPALLQSARIAETV